ncbi:MAG: flagellar export protein FliJ [Burkholderiaceae bacterium]|nr:flagellar export protein FliJ [Burkholderiaceae bacterium]
MANLTALDTLVLLSEQETDKAAESLGKAIARRADAQQRLAMLRELRGEYARKLQQHLHDGLSFAAYRNFQMFMEKIDRAIEGQQAIESDTSLRAEQAQQTWQDARREGRAWEVLVDRAGRERARHEARGERKLMDEFAARAGQPAADRG